MKIWAPELESPRWPGAIAEKASISAITSALHVAACCPVCLARCQSLHDTAGVLCWTQHDTRRNSVPKALGAVPDHRIKLLLHAEELCHYHRTKRLIETVPVLPNQQHSYCLHQRGPQSCTAAAWEPGAGTMRRPNSRSPYVCLDPCHMSYGITCWDCWLAAYLTGLSSLGHMSSGAVTQPSHVPVL